MTPLEVERGLRVLVALELREAVAEFNREAVSLSSIDRLRETVLRAADELAPPQADRGFRHLSVAGYSVRVDR